MASTTLLVAAVVFFALVATIAAATEVGGERVGGPPPLQVSSKDEKARACRTTGDAIVDIQSAVDGLSAMVVALSEEAGQGALLRAAAKVRAKLSNPSETTTASNEEAWKSASFLDGLVSHLATAPSTTNGCGELLCLNGISSLTASLLSPLRRSHDTLCGAEKLAAPFHHADGGSNNSSISAKITRAVSLHDGEHHHQQLPHQRQQTVASGDTETPPDANVVAHFVLRTAESNALRSRREDTAAARSYSCRWDNVRQAIRQGSRNFARDCTLFEDACEELPPESPLRVNLPQGASALLLTLDDTDDIDDVLVAVTNTQLGALVNLTRVHINFLVLPRIFPLAHFFWPASVTTLQITTNERFIAFDTERQNSPLRKFPRLQHLFLSLRNVQTLAPNLFKPLTSLKHLSLNGTRLKSLPPTVLHPLTALEELDLGSNDLFRLEPGMFSAQASLRVLDLGYNELQSLPESVFDGCTSLSTLSLLNNQLGELNDRVFSRLTRLTYLDLDRNNLASLPAQLFSAQTALTSLFVRENRLANLPPRVFRACTSLHQLHMNGNRLAALPAMLLAEQTVLKVLNLDDNQLCALPVTVFSRQSQLTSLSLQRNHLTSLPPRVFDQCTSLATLLLSENNLSELSSTIFGSLQRLESLALSANELTLLPPATFEGQGGLLQLYLDRNSFHHLDAHVFQHQSQLTALHLERNELTSLPSSVFEATTSLNTLRVFANSLTVVPSDVFARLSSLQELRISDNKLTSLPKNVFANLTSLISLRLDENRLMSIPEGIFDEMTLLEVLRLNRNALTRMPPEALSRLSMLRFLRLNDNDLRDIPASFLQANQHLEELLISNNRELKLPAGLLRSLRNPLSIRLENTRQVDGINSSFIAEVLRDWTLETLSIGWPALNEETLPIEVLCSHLAPTVSLLSITNSGYKRFDSCPGIAINHLRLSRNPELVSITTGRHHIVEAIDSPRLNFITGTERVDILNLSGTRMRYIPDLCEKLGTTLLLARDMRDIEAFDPLRLLRHCFLHGTAFDFTRNINEFSNLNVLAQTLPRRVVLDEGRSERAVFDDSGEEAQFRPNVPIYLHDNSKIQCQVDFELATLEQERAPVATFTTTCSCPVGFERADDGLCMEIPAPRAPVVEIVVGSAVAFSLFTLVVQYAVRWLKRKKRERYMLLEEKELQERLLSEATQEVAELKQGWKINLSEINLITKVDEGAFGAVWKGEWDGVGVAVKFLKLASVDMLQDYMLSDIEKEVDFLQRTRHPNLVRFFGTGTDSYGAPFLVLEFVDFGSLKHLLHEKGLEEAIIEARKLNRPQSMSLSDELSAGEFDGERDAEEGMMGFVEVTQEPASDAFESVMNVYDSTTQYSFKARIASTLRLKLCLVQDIADGMAFLHSLNVMHRDLKSGNVLVNKKLVAKITDFGSMSGKLATFQQSQLSASDASGTLGETAFDELQYSSSSTQATVAGMTMTAGVGTPLYMAPETLDPKNKKQTLKADVFSFGVLMWEICENRVPDLIEQELGSDFKGFLMQTLFRLYSEGHHLAFADENADDDDTCPGWYRDLALACMSFGPSQRPTFEEIKDMIDLGRPRIAHSRS